MLKKNQKKGAFYSTKESVPWKWRERTPEKQTSDVDPKVKNIISKARFAYSGLSEQIQNMNDRISMLESKPDPNQEKTLVIITTLNKILIYTLYNITFYTNKIFVRLLVKRLNANTLNQRHFQFEISHS